MTTKSIYNLYDAAFARVSAYIVLDAAGVYIAKVSVKYPVDGAGRVYAYVHVFGAPMVRGSASGGGYDKRSAACASAAKSAKGWPDAFRVAMLADAGTGWASAVTAAGYTVLQAI
jgi:hypothetical protein